ncbi:MAG: hypothetical protein V1681_04925 [Candidatus Neomarinimicrobiota bacterium]
MFSVRDVARVQGIGLESARVLCSRSTKSGQFIRIRNNLYILTERWSYLTLVEKLRLANRIQVPSYISLSTAVFYHEISDQLYRGAIESVAQKRSIAYPVRDQQFTYRLIKPDYYKGFSLRDGVFMAEPEKALADVIYFSSIGRYAFDFRALDWRHIDRSRLMAWLAALPEKTKTWWKDNGNLSNP